VIGGSIVIHLRTNSFSIANTGNNIPLPAEKIFERFSKINPSSQGTGLGLAIVKKIAELNRWKINYHHDMNLHTFIIDF
jgi:signal transduction histidine kinase